MADEARKQVDDAIASVPKEAISDALAAELGIENRGDLNEYPGAVENFFREAGEAMSVVEEPDPSQRPVDTPVGDRVESAANQGAGDGEMRKWVHEPTGREFDSELDMLRFETGWKSNQIGELRAANEVYEKTSAQEESSETPQISPSELDKQLVAIALQNTGIDPDDAGEQFKLVAKMSDNILNAYHVGMRQELEKLGQRIEQMQTASEESQRIADVGLTREAVQDVLKKHPGLAALPPEQRVAVVADLARMQQKGEEPKSTLHQRLQPDAASHVEGSVSSTPPDEGRDPFAKFWGLTEKDKLRALGSWFEDSDVGRRIKDAHI